MDGPRSTASADQPPADHVATKPSATSDDGSSEMTVETDHTPESSAPAEQPAVPAGQAEDGVEQPTGGASPGITAEADSTSGNRAGGLLRLAAVTAGLWWLGLLLLAAGTANPVTLNRAQILSSTAVVIGTVLDVEQGTVQVTEQFHGLALPEEITVGRLTEAGAKQGQSYVIPLSGLPPDELQVEQSPLPGHPPLIYPATEDAIRQLTALRTDNPDFQVLDLPDSGPVARDPAAGATSPAASPRQRFRPPVGPETGPLIGPSLPEE